MHAVDRLNRHPQNRVSTAFTIITVIALLVWMDPASAWAGDWQGKEETKDGALHIMNPDQPSEEKTEIKLEERWRIGGDTENEDEFFGVLTEIAADEAGNIYLLDAQLHQIMIFSSDGEFIRSIGRQGEGPGEFRRPNGLMLLPGGTVGVVQGMPGKIVLLTPDGEPAGNHPVPPAEDDGTQFFSSARCASGQIVAAARQFARKETSFEVTSKLIAFDANGNQTALYMQRDDSRDFAKMVFDEKEMGAFDQWVVGVDGRVYASTVFDAYRIDVWNRGGDVDRIIERKYESRRRTKEEMQKASDGIRIQIRRGNSSMQPEKKISETDRDILALYPRDDGSLWVLSSRGGINSPEGVIGTFDVFDPKGRFVRQVTLKGQGSFRGDGFHFVKNRLYVVTDLRSARDAMFGGGESNTYDEDAEEPVPMSVICYDLELQLHGMSR